MKPELITVFFYVSIAIVVVALPLAFARLASQQLNRFRALAWIETMDLQYERQRYQGSRTEIVADIASSKKSSVSYEVFVACRTPSGRAFYLSVTSTFGQVTDWALYPTSLEEMATFMEESGLDTTALRAHLPVTPARLAPITPPHAIPGINP